MGKSTRARVFKAAEKLNYTPDPIARELVKGESKRIGVMFTVIMLLPPI